MRRALSRWMPWSEVSRFGEEIHDQSDGVVPLVGFLGLATVIASLTLPRLSLLISILGGLVIVTAVTLATGQHRNLMDGLAEIGGFPSLADLARMAWQMTLTDLQRLWCGNARVKTPMTEQSRDGPPSKRRKDTHDQEAQSL